jgi:hypothetical protein
MQFTTEQFRQISAAHLHGRAGALQHSVDQALPRDRQADPGARLQALAAEVLAQVQPPELAPMVAVDLQQARSWLQLGLAQGVVYREARCAALLHAAAALGALWFVDDRLLPPPQQPPLSASLADSMAGLLAGAQGARFKCAADTERQRRVGLRRALGRVLQEGATPESTQMLLAAAFNAVNAATEADADQEDDSPPALDNLGSAAAQRFISHERRLMEQAGIAPGPVHTLCLAGDLAFGLGRCVRWLVAAGPGRDETARLAHLRELIHGLAGRTQ